MNKASLSIHFAPLLNDSLMSILVLMVCAIFLISVFTYKKGAFIRLLCASSFLLVLFNPSIIQEKREPVKDVLAVIIDNSPSQTYGLRTERTNLAVNNLKEKLNSIPELEVRMINAPTDANSLMNETKLFDPLEKALSDVPLNRRAGAIFITDGQIHDIPKDIERFNNFGPVHGLLSGDKNEKDRQLVILEAPAYGIVGQSVTIKYRIEDTANVNKRNATLFIKQNHKKNKPEIIPVNKDLTLDITVEHAGQNILDLEVSSIDDEITLSNNRAPIIINGVRDRLRVLLVSGQPHAGERTWRNILTSDPGVDLVHFTILREPNKVDVTPQNELSLIAFPFRELFEIKLYDFDLIIFDRYRLNRILPNYYFANIARYVREGGALLEASGPSYAGPDSIYSTALKDVLPAYPLGHVIESSFKPTLTDTGKRHPVTQNLHWYGVKENDPGWGSWLRQIAVSPKSGNTLLGGHEEHPLLILDRVGEGRIAQLASDHIWLWSRGYQGGGPQAELLRRLAHWLMKEPELEENALEVSADSNTLIIKRRSLTETNLTITITSPKGEKTTLELLPGKNGWLEGKTVATELGVYTVDDGEQIRFAVIGELNPPELRGVKTTDKELLEIVEHTNGSIKWLIDNDNLNVRSLSPSRNYAGNGWIGVRSNKSYSVSGVSDRPFVSEWVYALLLMVLLIITWWLEGKTQKKSD
jgi:hypothetical protein